MLLGTPIKTHWTAHPTGAPKNQGLPQDESAQETADSEHRFFHSFASAESAVLRAVVSLVTPLARVRR